MRISPYLLSLVICVLWITKESNIDIEKLTLEQERERQKKYLKCDFETYVEYQDSLPLFAEPNGEIKTYFRFEDDPTYEYGGGFLFKTSILGWLQIGNDKNYGNLEGYWIQSDYIKIGTKNYSQAQIPLYENPSLNSEIQGYILEEVSLNVLNCESEWVFVEYNGKLGWLSPEAICVNPVTNCN